MLYHSCDGSGGKGILPCHAGRHGILEGNACLRLSGRYQSVGSVLRRLHDLYLQTFLFKIALFLCHIQSGMVGVGGPVQDEGQLLQLFSFLPAGFFCIISLTCGHGAYHCPA